MARTYRDRYGIPHVRGGDVLDVARGQGAACGRDRSWQLEWLRRRATGTTAALFGEPAEPWDAFAVELDLTGTARRAHAALSEPARAFVAAYVEGLNAALDQSAPELRSLGVPAAAWEDWMPLATFHAQHILFAGFGGILWQRHARRVLGPDAALLSHEPPLQSGSNAWAVGGGRTASGFPLIGGDPHRVIEQPGVYHQVRLACEDPEDPFDVVGFSFAGVPGVQHFAHAGEVAWAITNAYGDYQSVEVADGVPHSFRNASTELGDLGFEALLPLLRARSADDVDAALDHWVEPVNNVVIADRAGTVRYRWAGRVPTRGWDGWVSDPHRVDVGPEGQLVTANERRGPQSAEIGSGFAAPYRARRIARLLDGHTGLTPSDFAAIHNDTDLATVAVLGSLVPGAFAGFDARMDADSTAAGRFAAWRSALVRRVAAEPVFADLHEPPYPARYRTVFASSLDATYRIALALPTLVGAGARPFGIDLAAHARAALAEVDDGADGGADGGGRAPAWGQTHVARPVHAFDLMSADQEPPELPQPAVSGDTDCVRCTASYPGQTDVCTRGSVARYVWDLADRQRSGWVVPTGAHGDPASPHHHDQLAAWAAGDLVPVVTDWELLTPEETSGSAAAPE